MILSELLRKWFGLDPVTCPTCEVLREQLANCERERALLLHRILDSRDKTEPPPVEIQEHRPVQPAFIPWRVRQQLLEAEDRKKAELLGKRRGEIDDLEKELGVADAPQKG